MRRAPPTGHQSQQSNAQRSAQHYRFRAASNVFILLSKASSLRSIWSNDPSLDSSTATLPSKDTKVADREVNVALISDRADAMSGAATGLRHTKRNRWKKWGRRIAGNTSDRERIDRQRGTGGPGRIDRACFGERYFVVSPAESANLRLRKEALALETFRLIDIYNYKF